MKRKSQSRFREELITSRSRERNSNYPGRILGGLLGRVGSDRSYVWENGGVGQLRNDNSRRTRLSEIVRLGERVSPIQAKFAVFSLPMATAKVPDDRALIAELGKIKTNEARALGIHTREDVSVNPNKKPWRLALLTSCFRLSGAVDTPAGS